MKLFKIFILLFVFTCIGIFLREFIQHLFSVSSTLTLSENKLFVEFTEDNKIRGIIGALSGPVFNLFLVYVFYFIYAYYKKHLFIKMVPFLFGISNAFLILCDTITGLFRDVFKGVWDNDLTLASKLLSINIWTLPIIFTILAFIPFRLFLKDQFKYFKRRLIFSFILLLAWSLGRLFLYALDEIFNISFQIM